ncbi:MAG TPA: sodium-independent anion transporter, partial [Thermoanaerobaculia bacterium]
VSRRPRVFILRMRHVPIIDATGIRVLDELHQSFSHAGVRMILSGLRIQPRAVLERAGRLDRFGRENFAPDLDAALALARETLEKPPGTRAIG